MEDTDTDTSSATKPISTLAHKRKPISLASMKKITKAKRRRDEEKDNNIDDQNQTVQLRYDHDDDDDDDEVEGEDEREEEVERRIEALQRIVPGGERLSVDKLFEETAGYIMALQCQLKAMRTLATLFQALDKQGNTKFGG